jgi:hypothetical protein
MKAVRETAATREDWWLGDAGLVKVIIDSNGRMNAGPNNKREPKEKIDGCTRITTRSNRQLTDTSGTLGGPKFWYGLADEDKGDMAVHEEL